MFERPRLPPGRPLRGPCLVFDRYSVTAVEPGWRGSVDGAGALALRRDDRQDEARATDSGGGA